jgi:K+-sensing histidine kinase KdpD
MIKRNALVSILPLLGVSISLSAGAMLLSWLLFSLSGNSAHYILAMLAVILSFWYGGIRAGFLTVFLTAFAIGYLFIEPHNSFLINTFSSLLDLLIFFFSGITITAVLDRFSITNKKKKNILSC